MSVSLVGIDLRVRRDFALVAIPDKDFDISVRTGDSNAGTSAESMPLRFPRSEGGDHPTALVYEGGDIAFSSSIIAGLSSLLAIFMGVLSGMTKKSTSERQCPASASVLNG